MTLELLGRMVREDGELSDADAFMGKWARSYGLSLEELVDGSGTPPPARITRVRREIALHLLGEGLRICDVAFLMRLSQPAVAHYKAGRVGTR